MRRCACVVLILSTLACTLHGQQLSLREQAGRAFAAKDYVKARMLLERWLEADPGDAAAWYNLSAVHALTGNKVKAVEAFERAVGNGFLELDLVQQDANLETIRSEPRFKAAFDRLAANHKESIPDGFIARMAPMRTLGTYIVMLPPDYETSGKDYPLCIILHGSGSTELEHGRIADELGRDGVIYAAVRAPFPALSLIAGTRKPAYTAWPIEAGRNFEPARSAYIEWILDVADYVREEFRVRQGKVFLWGHSQGGQFAKMTALLHPDQIASYLSQAGSSVPADMITEDRLADMKSQGVDVWLVHGIGDPSVPASTSTSFAERLKAAGMTVKLFLEEGDHSVNAAMINIGRRWIAEVVKKSP